MPGTVRDGLGRRPGRSDGVVFVFDLVRRRSPARHGPLRSGRRGILREERPPVAVGAVPGVPRPVEAERRLALDARAAIVAGGESGPAVVPGDARASLLIDAINYGEDHQMPPKSKLPAPEIATLTRWVQMGVPGAAERHPHARRRAYRRISRRSSASGLDTGPSSPSGRSRRRRGRKPALGAKPDRSLHPRRTLPGPSDAIPGGGEAHADPPR